MEQGYEKTSSDNLPHVDADMVDEFYREHFDFLSAEGRNVKTKRAARGSYGDNAVGYVQLKRDGVNCSVKGKITPEHKTLKASYVVVAVINEAEEKIESSDCLSCTASTGGCKHGIAFLFWLHRRSEEPSVTSQTCYWSGSKLSKVGRSKKFMSLSELCGKEIPPLKAKSGTFVTMVLDHVKGAEGVFFDINRTSKFYNTSIYQLARQYCETGNDPADVDACIEFSKERMTLGLCKDAEEMTRSQSNCPAWYELRFGRITASRIHGASRCKTKEGSLVESILGASKLELTAAIQRGRDLESVVINAVGKIRKIKISPCGLILKPNFPVFGASPDGLSDDYVIEVKCPSKEKTVSNYVDSGEVKDKFKAQVQMQMFFAGKTKALFCVARPDFEQSKSVDIYELTLDVDYCTELMEHALVFWKTAIYPFLID